MLFGFGFSSLWMLGWLAAAAVPVLLHLWNRRNRRETNWAAMEFLLTAMSQNSRRIRVEQWLLLLVRTAIIVLAVMAVAGPYLERTTTGFQQGQPAHKVLVLDGSYSMDYRIGEQTRFQRAKQLASQIIAESRQGDGFSLVVMGQPPQVIIGEPSFDTDIVTSLVQAIALPHAGGDLGATLAQVQQIVQQATNDFPRLTRHEVCFLTDLGRTSWLTTDPAKHMQLSDQAATLAGQASLAVIDLGQTDFANTAVTDLAVEQPYVTVVRDAVLQATLRNFGSRTAQHRLQFLVDDQRVHEESVTVEPGSEQSVTYRHRFAAPGSHVVEARIPDDPLSVDNHRWLSVDVKEQLRVLCVNGNAVTGGFRGEADYLVAALTPELGRDDQQPIHTEVITESRLTELQLENYDCVILANVGQFTESEATILADYAASGGGLIFFLGDRVQHDSYNRTLGPTSAAKLLPAELLESYSGQGFRFDPLQFQHPIVRPFQGNPSSGLLIPQVYRYWRLRIPDSSSAQVALAFEGSGDAAILESTSKNSRSIVVAFPASLASVDPVTREPWTIMPKLPTFVPLVQEMVARAVSMRMHEKNFSVHETLQLRNLQADSKVRYVETPGGDRMAARALPAPEQGWVFDKTAQSGVYRIQQPGREPLLAAVNVHPRESDLAKIDDIELPDAFRMLEDWTTSESQPSPTTSMSASQGLERWFLYAALVLLLFESALAWFFGHRGT